MAALLRDPRWSELAHDTVSHVVIMGGLIEAEDGELLADAGATNNTYDPESAAMVYGSLIKDDGLGKNIQLIVVTRHAAGAVRLPKRALDGSSHPTAVRLTTAEHLSLQKLWARSHMTHAERVSDPPHPPSLDLPRLNESARGRNFALETWSAHTWSTTHHSHTVITTYMRRGI